MSIIIRLLVCASAERIIDLVKEVNIWEILIQLRENGF